MNSKLLSICIPTYNRCETLDGTLSDLFSNPDFDSNLVEVIVSDNCSTDNTREIVAKYPLVRYYKNKENIKDKNFSLVLSYAESLYIRLFNDTLRFNKGALKQILKLIDKHKNDGVNLFFYANIFNNNNCVKTVSTKKEFLNEVSFYSTWIANFGCWKNTFDKIDDLDRCSDLQFVQVDWSYRIVGNDNKSIIYFSDNTHVATPCGKGGYNIFNTFINNYLGIIKREDLPFKYYETEKYRLFIKFIFPWLYTLLVANNESYSFELKGAWKIIFSKYWYEPYLYFFVTKFFVIKTFK